MTNAVATIVRCADLVDRLYPTLESIERQSAGRGEIVFVTDESTSDRAREWIEALARSRGLSSAHAAAVRPGCIRNAGVRATISPYLMCLDAGDAIDARFHDLLREKLDTQSDVDVVTTGIRVVGPGSTRRIIVPPVCTLDGLVGDTTAIHDASMFRRAVWTAVDGFDESLPALDDYDFWLRLLHAGRHAAIVELPLLIRRLRGDTHEQRALARQRHRDAMTLVVRKHQTVFERAPAHALYARGRLQEMRERNFRLIARRESALKEIDALKARARDLRQKLPHPDEIDLADLRRTTPVARDWGYERGTPVDRHYIETFLASHGADIRGAVLEVQESDYTRRFGGERVTRSDVLDLNPANPLANVVSDLRSAANIASNTYDCIILTQTLHVVDDMPAVISECARILKPGGVLLVTMPCASRVCLEYGDDGDFWRVTEAGARRLFCRLFPEDALEVRAHGNVLVNAAFLYGLARHELTDAEFNAVDPYFPLLVTVRAKKPGSAGPVAVGPSRNREFAAAILLYHRVGNPVSDVHGLSVAPQQFHRQMAWLREHCNPIPLDTLAAAAREGSVPPGSVAVTFDDGYVDNYTNASPILCSLGVPATFFVTTDRLDEEYEFWWDTLERILLAPSSPLQSELRIDLPNGTRTFQTRSDDDRLALYWDIYRAIVGSTDTERDGVIQALIRWSGASVPSDPAHRRMNPAEIAALAVRNGHTIGAHSVKHLMLPRQAADVQCHEILESRRVIEALLARPVRAFAYPFGAFSDATVQFVREASFDVAVTCETGPMTAHDDPLRLPRLEVTREAAGRFGDWLSEHGVRRRLEA